MKSKIPAAKIHVLGLSALQERLGPKWGRLSGLVHKLFEASITRELGPFDHFIKINELSYAVTFHDLSPDEANVACLAIAKDVCQALFGELDDEISVRSLVGEISRTILSEIVQKCKLIEQAVEASGQQTIVTCSTETKSSEPLVWESLQSGSSAQSPLERVQAAHALTKRFGLRLGFFPAWELERVRSHALFLLPFRGAANNVEVTGPRALEHLDPIAVCQIEVALLKSAAAYAQRLHFEQEICAVGVGVSYETLTCLGTRVRYLTALQDIPTFLSNPLWLRIQKIPVGASLKRVAELVARLKVVSVRVSAEFEKIDSLPEIDINLGVIALGGLMPSSIDAIAGSKICDTLVRQAATQRGFAFLDHLDSMEFVSVARKSRVRFGRGMALGLRHLSGLEDVPKFPIIPTDWK